MDVFTQLTQCFDVVSKLECPDPEIMKRYMKRFAKTIVKVLIAYADIVKKEFPEHLKEERIVSFIKMCLYFPNITNKLNHMTDSVKFFEFSDRCLYMSFYF